METIQIEIQADIADAVAHSANERLAVLGDLQLLLVGGGCGETVFD